jgi:uncharacterized iron-regulated protein
MTRFFLSLLLLSSAFLSASAQKGNPAYQILTGEGKKSSYEKMLKAAQGADIVMFGELHNNPISHWLQLELTQDLTELRELSAGAEMFEHDQQQVMEDYFNGVIPVDTFERRMRNWPNYETDYKPWLEFLHGAGVMVNATNVPRKYASMVFKSGLASLDTLSDKERGYMVPLPYEVDFELESYQEMIEMMGGHGGQSEDFVRAQALKDATMAHFILATRKPGSLYIHLNGAFHSDKHEGIVWYLRKAQPNLKIVTISTREYEDFRDVTEEALDLADFVIAVPATMTKTH